MIYFFSKIMYQSLRMLFAVFSIICCLRVNASDLQHVLDQYPDGWKTLGDVGRFSNRICRFNLDDMKHAISETYRRTNDNIQNISLKLCFLMKLYLVSPCFIGDSQVEVYSWYFMPETKVQPDIYNFCKNFLDETVSKNCPEDISEKRYLGLAFWEIQAPILINSQQNKLLNENYDISLISTALQYLLQADTEFAKSEVWPVVKKNCDTIFLDSDALRQYGCV